MELDLISCEQTTDTYDILDWRGLKITRINRTTRGLSGKSFYHVPLDESFTLEGLIATKQGGEYRQRPYRMQPRPLCTILKDDKLVYQELVASSDFPNPATCPFPNVNVCFDYGLIDNFIKLRFRELTRLTATVHRWVLSQLLFWKAETTQLKPLSRGMTFWYFDGRFFSRS